MKHRKYFTVSLFCLAIFSAINATVTLSAILATPSPTPQPGWCGLAVECENFHRKSTGDCWQQARGEASNSATWRCDLGAGQWIEHDFIIPAEDTCFCLLRYSNDTLIRPKM
ncbi:hypothetical protein JW905_16965 [bacterium]|nr:hypothetical protein [candidate division CSSED10-310 bacterium]